MTEILNVDLDTRGYPIIWERSFNELVARVHSCSHDTKQAFVTNELIYELYKDHLKELFPNARPLIIPDGEKEKNFQRILTLSEELLNNVFHRNASLWAFGGGVIGDITGFLASIYMRGISYYQIPTTLLSMVDSSVGGKTGVNIRGGKNIIGTFYQPQAVFIHADFLKTLPEREIKCGLSEIIKTGLIHNEKLLSVMEERSEEILAKDLDTLNALSRMSVEVKSWVVENDERETNLRAILNLGHTLAHAFESYYNYGDIKHGEAVSVGLAYAAHLSKEMGLISEEETSRLNTLFQKLKLMHRWQDLPGQEKPTSKELLALMKGDKKNKDENIRFVLIDNIGSHRLPEKVKDEVLLSSLESFQCL